MLEYLALLVDDLGWLERVDSARRKYSIMRREWHETSATFYELTDKGRAFLDLFESKTDASELISF